MVLLGLWPFYVCLNDWSNQCRRCRIKWQLCTFYYPSLQRTCCSSGFCGSINRQYSAFPWQKTSGVEYRSVYTADGKALDLSVFTVYRSNSLRKWTILNIIDLVTSCVHMTIRPEVSFQDSWSLAECYCVLWREKTTDDRQSAASCWCVYGGCFLHWDQQLCTGKKLFSFPFFALAICFVFPAT